MMERIKRWARARLRAAVGVGPQPPPAPEPFPGIRLVGSHRPLLEVGLGTYVNGMDVYCWDPRIRVEIGRYCSIADKITLVAGGEHDKSWVSTYPFIDRWSVSELADRRKPRFKGDIRIGHDVWIANNVTILSGVRIGDGAVIGAGAVVSKDVPAYGIAVGCPATVRAWRFPPEIIAALLDIQWWHWSEERIRANLDVFDNVTKFLERVKPDER